MSNDLPPELRAELLNDFYSEADEHLSAIRDGVLALEASLGGTRIDAPTLEKLFRSFHSFKGISAIVGLREAETLAHGCEDYLRDLSRQNATITREGLDVLMAAAHALEQIVGAHREQQPLPGIAALLAQLNALTSADTVANRAAATKQQQDRRVAGEVEIARTRGAVVWQCTFVPSPELDARGVNVNSVRARLSEVGEILRGTPEVRPGGSIAFVFIVSLRETLPNLDEWERDGIAFQPFEPGTAAAVEPARENPLAPGAAHNPFVAPSHVVRVDLSRLDELMRITGELVIHRSRFEQELVRTARSSAAIERDEMEEVNDLLARSLRDLREAIMRVRLVPVAEIFSRMPFVVRDLARETGKRVRLALSGQQTEIDKFLIERLKDPLLHLVRNSVSHGIEEAAERRQSGKPEEATISLSATTVGDHVLIGVADDGRGVDAERVAQRAREQGLRVPDVLDGPALLALLCEPGFSTRDEADRAAGRGVGMAVVNNTVRELGGTLTMESTPGSGTRFVLRLPLTLAIAEAFIVSSGSQTFAVPQTFVQEIMQMETSVVHRVNGTELLPYRDGVLPLFHLSSLVRSASASARALVLVLSSDRGSVGLVVDQVHGQREVVVRSMRDPLLKVPGIAGATELGDGRPILILDAAALTDRVVRPHSMPMHPALSVTSMAIAS